MDWARDREIWPNATHSRFVDVKPHRWHVQEAGTGPTVLLLHGAGGATQSWRTLFPILMQHAHVVALDLPGQGFTRMGTRQRCGLGPMAEDLARLCDHEGWQPDLIVGHSAGAALALQLSPQIGNPPVIGLNAALSKFDGMAGWLFPLMAKMMALNPMIPPLLARLAGGEERTRELLETTGSTLDPVGVALYRRLMSDKGHIDGTLTMMSQWNIDPLLARLAEIDTPTTLLVGTQDGTVPADVSHSAARLMPQATVKAFEGLGHLMHEEDAALIATEILAQIPGQTRAVALS
ncbi:MAG: alpha/beta fold hydrolase BchO [Pseudomonadota bacterium]